jgi:hypothetical protein
MAETWLLRPKKSVRRSLQRFCPPGKAQFPNILNYTPLPRSACRDTRLTRLALFPSPADGGSVTLVLFKIRTPFFFECVSLSLA